jgi:hypothetical protein
LTHLIRQLCPSDKRFVTSFLNFPDHQPVIGSLERTFSVIGSDMKAIQQDLAKSLAVLQKLMMLYKER